MNVSTPDISTESNFSNSRILTRTNSTESNIDELNVSQVHIEDPNLIVIDDPYLTLKNMRKKHMNRVIVGTLNINSLASKFEMLATILENSLDILILQETKLDSSFPTFLQKCLC